MAEQTTVIYNANCPICAREIDHYRGYAEAQDLPIAFRDLNTADLSALGLTTEDVARRLHVTQGDRLYAGVPAFAVLWEAMPRFRWLGRLVRKPVIKQVANAVYDGILAPILYAMHRRRVRRAQRADA